VSIVIERVLSSHRKTCCTAWQHREHRLWFLVSCWPRPRGSQQGASENHQFWLSTTLTTLIRNHPQAQRRANRPKTSGSKPLQSSIHLPDSTERCRCIALIQQTHNERSGCNSFGCMGDGYQLDINWTPVGHLGIEHAVLSWPEARSSTGDSRHITQQSMDAWIWMPDSSMADGKKNATGNGMMHVLKSAPSLLVGAHASRVLRAFFWPTPPLCQ
jgi:hypothetical protein